MNMDEIKKQNSDAFDRERGVSKYILVCSCFNMSKKASEAYALKFPDEVLPPIIKGRDRISKLAAETKNEHIKALSKLTGRFAYYVKLDENNNIVEEYNLVTGQRIA